MSEKTIYFIIFIATIIGVGLFTLWMEKREDKKWITMQNEKNNREV